MAFAVAAMEQVAGDAYTMLGIRRNHVRFAAGPESAYASGVTALVGILFALAQGYCPPITWPHSRLSKHSASGFSANARYD